MECCVIKLYDVNFKIKDDFLLDDEGEKDNITD